MKDEQLYEMIEQAVLENRPVVFPQDVYPLLQVCHAPTGPTFTIPELYWIDEDRNVYRAWMQIEYRRKDMFAGLYVKGTCTLDGFSSGDTSMLRPECRYRTLL